MNPLSFSTRRGRFVALIATAIVPLALAACDTPQDYFEVKPAFACRMGDAVDVTVRWRISDVDSLALRANPLVFDAHTVGPEGSETVRLSELTDITLALQHTHITETVYIVPPGGSIDYVLSAPAACNPETGALVVNPVEIDEDSVQGLAVIQAVDGSDAPLAVTSPGGQSQILDGADPTTALNGKLAGSWILSGQCIGSAEEGYKLPEPAPNVHLIFLDTVNIILTLACG